MRISPRVQKILSNYDSENPAVKAKLAQLLMNGRLGGTGKMIILPVDQGFEHGPARSFAPNPAAYDPHYHYQLAIDVVAYAAHLASQLGAHVIKVKLPSDFIEQKEAKKEFDGAKIAIGTQAERVAEVMRSCFAGRRRTRRCGGRRSRSA